MSCCESKATLLDLEDPCLWPWAPNGAISAGAGRCMHACGAGPNVAILGSAALEEPYGTFEVHTGVRSLLDSKRLVELAFPAAGTCTDYSLRS